jgi:hypothetical protein
MDMGLHMGGAQSVTEPLFAANGTPSLDEEIACQSDRWARTCPEPWTIGQMAAAIWGRRGSGDRVAFREEVRTAVERLVARGRVKVMKGD